MEKELSFKELKQRCNPQPKPSYGYLWKVCNISSSKECYEITCPILKQKKARKNEPYMEN